MATNGPYEIYSERSQGRVGYFYTNNFLYIGILRVATERRGWVDVELVVDWCFVAVAVASPSHMVLRM